VRNETKAEEYSTPSCGASKGIGAKYINEQWLNGKRSQETNWLS
jgi:hypothetical protein